MPNGKVNPDQNAVRRAAKQKQNAAARAKAANTKKTEAPKSLRDIRYERDNRAKFMEQRRNAALLFIDNVRKNNVGRIQVDGLGERLSIINRRLVGDVKGIIKSGELKGERFFWENVDNFWCVTVQAPPSVAPNAAPKKFKRRRTKTA